MCARIRVNEFLVKCLAVPSVLCNHKDFKSFKGRMNIRLLTLNHVQVCDLFCCGSGFNFQVHYGYCLVIVKIMVGLIA